MSTGRRTMSPEQWERVQQILHEALERKDTQREAFVADACAGDAALHDELVSLLHAYGRGALQSSPDEFDAPHSGELERLKRALGNRYATDRPLGAGGMATGGVVKARPDKSSHRSRSRVVPVGAAWCGRRWGKRTRRSRTSSKG